MEKNKLTSDFETKRKLDLFGSYPQRILDRACPRCLEETAISILRGNRNATGGKPVCACLSGSALLKRAPSSVACNSLLLGGIISVLLTLQCFCEASDS